LGAYCCLFACEEKHKTEMDCEIAEQSMDLVLEAAAKGRSRRQER